MAITNQGTTQNTALDGGNCTVDLTGLSLQVNDYVLVNAVLGQNAVETASLSISGYTTLISQSPTASSNKATNLVARKVQGATPDTSVTVTVTGGDTEMAVAVTVAAYRGVNPVTPEDATPVFATGSNAQPDSPSITTVTDGAQVITTVGASANDTAVTSPTGYGNQIKSTANDLFKADSAMADKNVATKGDEDPGAWSAWNQGTAIPWTAGTIALKPSIVPLRRRIEGY